MQKFQYDVIFRKQSGTTFTYRLSGSRNVGRGKSLAKLLNRLGAKGWEVAGCGNVFGSGAAEVIIKRPVKS